MVNTSFQSVELSLPELLLSRAPVRFTQPDKLNLLTDTVYFTLPFHPKLAVARTLLAVPRTLLA